MVMMKMYQYASTKQHLLHGRHRYTPSRKVIVAPANQSDTITDVQRDIPRPSASGVSPPSKNKNSVPVMTSFPHLQASVLRLSALFPVHQRCLIVLHPPLPLDQFALSSFYVSQRGSNSLLDHLFGGTGKWFFAHYRGAVFLPDSRQV